MESAESLRHKLALAERCEQIDKEIDKSRCPICKSKLKYEFNAGYDGLGSPYHYGEIHCTSCDMFKKTVHRSHNDSLKWINNDDEITLKNEVWDDVKPYVIHLTQEEYQKELDEQAEAEAEAKNPLNAYKRTEHIIEYRETFDDIKKHPIIEKYEYDRTYYDTPYGIIESNFQK